MLVCKKLAVEPYSAPTVLFNSSFQVTTLFDFPSLSTHPLDTSLACSGILIGGITKLPKVLICWDLMFSGMSLRYEKDPRLVKI